VSSTSGGVVNTHKVASLLLAVLVVMTISCTTSKKCPSITEDTESLYADAVSRFCIVMSDNLYPGTLCGNGYVIASKISVFDPVSNENKKFAIAFMDQRDSDSKIVVDYGGFVLIKTSLTTPVPVIKFSNSPKLGERLFYTQVIVWNEDGVDRKTLIVKSTEISGILDKKLIVTQPFMGPQEVGIALFDKGGRLAALGGDAMFGSISVANEKISYLTLGTVTRSSVVSHFEIVIDGTLNSTNTK